MNTMTRTPFRVAVVGAGPAGLYTADELVRQDRIPTAVDLLDRLCTPFGLVRYGVAPDHPRIKSVTGALNKILEHPRVRFLGGIELGSDVSRSDLLANYDSVVYATGLPADRQLGIDGEDLAGCHSAREFVSWYSGHPDALQPFALDAARVVVVGAGNVALDVARVLTKPVDALRHTDMPGRVLDVLAASAVREVVVVVRRGPEHTRFTTKELRELDELEGVTIRIPADEVLPTSDSVTDRTARANLALFEKWRGTQAGERTITIRFWRQPVAARGTGSVRELVVEETSLDASGALSGTGRTEVLPAGAVLRSVGYYGKPLADLPFDVIRGTVPHLDGRLVDHDNQVCAREYVVGWLKRGPSGVIGTNRADAADTVAVMLTDLEASGAPRTTTAIDGLLRERKIEPVQQLGWRAIDSAEIALGARSGRDRVKITEWSELRSLGSGGAPLPANSDNRGGPHAVSDR